MIVVGRDSLSHLEASGLAELSHSHTTCTGCVGRVMGGGAGEGALTACAFVVNILHVNLFSSNICVDLPPTPDPIFKPVSTLTLVWCQHPPNVMFHTTTSTTTTTIPTTTYSCAQSLNLLSGRNAHGAAIQAPVAAGAAGRCRRRSPGCTGTETYLPPLTFCHTLLCIARLMVARASRDVWHAPRTTPSGWLDMSGF